jgi:hypothetical protein
MKTIYIVFEDSTVNGYGVIDSIFLDEELAKEYVNNRNNETSNSSYFYYSEYPIMEKL